MIYFRAPLKTPNSRLAKFVKMILSEYSGQYIRKIWFLYEWLMQKKLPIADLTFKNFVPLLDDTFDAFVSRSHPGVVFYDPVAVKVFLSFF